jgi:hypothetical protein
MERYVSAPGQEEKKFLIQNPAMNGHVQSEVSALGIKAWRRAENGVGGRERRQRKETETEKDAETEAETETATETKETETRRRGS